MIRARARWLGLVLPCALAACGGPRASGPYSYEPTHSTYRAPGSADDPWGPYITEASRRFDVPEGWIRGVMHQESGGHEYLNGQPITSPVGAMGLMQLMPATYADLQAQYGLGSDPFDPHDNIMAGTGYIRQMYDRFGSPGFLAAYNAGPARVDDYLAGQGGLPNETVNYVASIAPYLGGGSAPITVAPDQSPVELASTASAPSGGACWHDPDAAFDPHAPCGSPPPPIETASNAAPACESRDADAAYDPGAPCPTGAPPPHVQEAVYRPMPSAIGGAAPLAPPSGMAQDEPPAPAPEPVSYARPAPEYAAPMSVGGAWAIQVGAFGRPGEARFATAMARDAAPSALEAAREVVMQVPGLRSGSLYRARFAGLHRVTAAAACSQLRRHDMPCILIQPGG